MSAPFAAAFRLSIRPGMVEEYRRRHAAIWPQMREALLASGIRHYEIWLDAERQQVFGVLLSDRLPDEAEHPTIRRWRAFMADVLEMEGDRPVRAALERVFLLIDDQSQGRA